MIEAETAPLARVAGARSAILLADRWRAEGVDAPPGRADRAGRARTGSSSPTGRRFRTTRCSWRSEPSPRPTCSAGPAGSPPTRAGARGTTGVRLRRRGDASTGRRVEHWTSASGQASGRRLGDPRVRPEPYTAHALLLVGPVRAPPADGRDDGRLEQRRARRRPRSRSGHDTSTRKGSLSPCCSAIGRPRSRRRGASSRRAA